MFCGRSQTHRKCLSVIPVLFWIRALSAFSLSVDVLVLLLQIIESGNNKTREKGAGCVVAGGFANLSGENKLLRGYELLVLCARLKGFKSSPAAAPHLACWKCGGLALKLLWLWSAGAWWCLCGSGCLDEGGAPLPEPLWPLWQLHAQAKTPRFAKCCSIQELQYVTRAAPWLGWVQRMLVKGRARGGWGLGPFALAA